MIIGRDVIVAVSDADFGIVDVPEYGEGAQIRVRSLTGAQRTKLSEAETGSSRYAILAAVMGMVDESGAYLFPDVAEGERIVGAKHPEIVDRIASRVILLSNMTKSQRVELEKKLATQRNGSGSTLPEPSTQVTGSISIP